jgi:hypothetical protein
MYALLGVLSVFLTASIALQESSIRGDRNLSASTMYDRLVRGRIFRRRDAQENVSKQTNRLYRHSRARRLHNASEK